MKEEFLDYKVHGLPFPTNNSTTHSSLKSGTRKRKAITAAKPKFHKIKETAKGWKFY